MPNTDIINNIKVLLRIAEDDSAFDSEINDLVLQCRDDLMAAGVKIIYLNFDSNFIEIDGNIRTCIVLYVKAFFGGAAGDITSNGWFLKQYQYKKGNILNQQKYSGGDSNDI